MALFITAAIVSLLLVFLAILVIFHHYEDQLNEIMDWINGHYE